MSEPGSIGGVRVLFVDDDPNVLAGLRHGFRKDRARWDLVFACGGSEGLRAVAAAPFDVVISDMRMPEMDGAEFLDAVRERNPEAVRVVLSGDASEEAFSRVLPVAHQLHSKPCPVEVLRERIDMVSLLHRLMPDRSLRHSIGELRGLPAISCADVVSGSEAAAAMSRDASLAARTILLGASTWFGTDTAVASIDDALVRIGRPGLALMATSAAEAAGSFAAAVSASVGTRCFLASRLVERFLSDPGERVLGRLIALVHDLGEVVLATVAPDRFAQCRERERGERTQPPRHLIEREVIGVSHAAAGAYVLGLWGAAPSLLDAVAWHHEPSRSTANPRTLAAVRIADEIAAALIEQERAPEPVRLDMILREFPSIDPQLASEWLEIAWAT